MNFNENIRNELKLMINQGGVLTNLLIPQLLISQEH